MYFRAIRLGNEARGRRENERSGEERTSSRMLPDESRGSDVIFGNGSGRRGAARSEESSGLGRRGMLLCALAWDNDLSCVNGFGYAFPITQWWRGGNGPGVERARWEFRGKEMQGEGRDICTERGVKILNGRKYAWNVKPKVERWKRLVCGEGGEKINYWGFAFYEWIGYRMKENSESGCYGKMFGGW